MSDNTAQPTSPFAAPATTQAAPAPSPEVDLGDTSYLDNVPSQEPLLKPCTVPGIVRLIEVKQSAGGDDYLSITVQVYGDKMINEIGQPVAPGKRLTSSLFPFSKALKEQIDAKGRDVRNLLFALRDVPLNGQEMKVFATWPPAERPGLLKPKDVDDGSGNVVQRVAWSLYAFQPVSKWTETKVLVNVSIRKDKRDNSTRNEFNLLAASTPQKGGK
jgi:hypothetical protein